MVNYLAESLELSASFLLAWRTPQRNLQQFCLSSHKLSVEVHGKS
jgi:hypothetical protein